MQPDFPVACELLPSTHEDGNLVQRRETIAAAHGHAIAVVAMADGRRPVTNSADTGRVAAQLARVEPVGVPTLLNCKGLLKTATECKHSSGRKGHAALNR